MSVNVNAFKGSFKDFARPNRFFIQITRLDGSKLKFHCKSASIPGSTIQKIAVPHSGRTIPIAGDREYEDWNVTVMLDDTYQLRKELYQWHESINSTTGNVGAGSLSAYAVDSIVQALDVKGTPIATYNFTSLWPVTVGAVEHSQDSNNAVSECQVTFTYAWYVQG